MLRGLAYLFREWEYSAASPQVSPLLSCVDVFIESLWAACGLAGLQAASCTCKEIAEAVQLFVHMHTHLVVKDSGEITRDSCWYGFRRGLNLRTISVDGTVWSVSHLTSAAHLSFGNCSTAAAMIFAPFVATNLALESLTLAGADGRVVCHSRAWLHGLRGQPVSAAAAPPPIISLGSNASCDLTVIFAAALLARNGSATSLSAWDAGISDVGVGALAVYLRANTTLRSLNLSQNAIADEGATLLAHTLRHHPTLEVLVLQGNRIGVGGGVAIGGLVGANSRLQEVQLWGNELGDEGTAGLARGLGANSSVLTLDLRSNRIGDAGAAALGGALASNRSMRRLFLSWNQASMAIASVAIAGLPLLEPGGRRGRGGASGGAAQQRDAQGAQPARELRGRRGRLGAARGAAAQQLALVLHPAVQPRARGHHRRRPRGVARLKAHPDPCRVPGCVGATGVSEPPGTQQ